MINTKIDDALPVESIEKVFEIFSDGRHYVKLPWGVAYEDVLPAVKRLIAKMQRLERETMWLADHLEHTTEFCIKTQRDDEHCDKWLLDGACARCWREAARKACREQA